MHNIGKFEELGLNEKILRVIGEMHFEEPTEIQEKTIPINIIVKEQQAESSRAYGNP